MRAWAFGVRLAFHRGPSSRASRTRPGRTILRAVLVLAVVPARVHVAAASAARAIATTQKLPVGDLRAVVAVELAAELTHGSTPTSSRATWVHSFSSVATWPWSPLCPLWWATSCSSVASTS